MWEWSSVIVDNLDVMSVTVAPNETKAPFVGDADGMLTLAIMLEGFELVPGRKAKGGQLRGGGQHAQFAQGSVLNICKPAGMFLLEKLLCVTASEALNHRVTVRESDISVKRIVLNLRAACESNTEQIQSTRRLAPRRGNRRKRYRWRPQGASF